jgi:NADPH:quinone reductase
MRALLVDAANAPFRSIELERPRPAAGQVLVRINASGVNPLDIKIRRGQAHHARQPLPAVLGLDLAGVVEAIGDDVSTFMPGEEVYGMTGGVGGVQGSLAEFAAVDADLLARKPARLSMREAAALPLVFITAWEGLVDRAAVSAGDRVLVQGAGGVGRIVIQLARARGAQVWCVDSLEKHASISQLGAHPIDRAEPVERFVATQTAGAGFDIVYDTVGGPALDASFQAIRRFGHVVSALGWGTHTLAPLSFRGGTYSGVFTLLPLLTGEGKAHHGEILRQATTLVDAGLLTPHLDPRHFSFDTIEQAYVAIEDRTAAGKIVVEL